MATSTLGSGTLVLAGTTSGTTTVTATAVAGTTTLTLPAATDTLVGKATTDTLTNKTLTGAVMNGTVGATTPAAGAFTSITASTTLGVTGVATFSAGTAALPAITTTGDTNTGIFFSAADTINISTGGADKGRFSSNANGVFTVGTQSSVGSIGTDYGTLGAWGSSGGGLRIYRGTGGGTPIANFYADSTGVFLYGSEAVPLVFSTNATERARFTSTGGTFVLAGGSTGADGIGITFPATQSASANANTLDDYEEGTWTSSIANTANVTGTGTLDRADYIKIGNLVTIVGRISGLTITTITTGTAVGITLPFAAKDVNTVVMGSCRGSGGTEMIGILLDATGGDATSVALNFPAAQITSNGATTFSFSLTYIAV